MVSSQRARNFSHEKLVNATQMGHFAQIGEAHAIMVLPIQSERKVYVSREFDSSCDSHWNE